MRTKKNTGQFLLFYALVSSSVFGAENNMNVDSDSSMDWPLMIDRPSKGPSEAIGRKESAIESVEEETKMRNYIRDLVKPEDILKTVYTGLGDQVDCVYFEK